MFVVFIFCDYPALETVACCSRGSCEIIHVVALPITLFFRLEPSMLLFPFIQASPAFLRSWIYIIPALGIVFVPEPSVRMIWSSVQLS